MHTWNRIKLIDQTQVSCGVELFFIYFGLLLRKQTPACFNVLNIDTNTKRLHLSLCRSEQLYMHAWFTHSFTAAIDGPFFISACYCFITYLIV